MPHVSYFWDEMEDNVVEEYDGDAGDTIASYTTEPTLYGSVLSQDRAGEKRYFQFDGRHSTTQLTNASETITDHYTYSAFAQVSAHVGTTENNFQWYGASAFYVATTPGTYQTRLGMLSSETGRWLSPASLGNTYAVRSPIHWFADGLPGIPSIDELWAGLCAHMREERKRLLKRELKNPKRSKVGGRCPKPQCEILSLFIELGDPCVPTTGHTGLGLGLEEYWDWGPQGGWDVLTGQGIWWVTEGRPWIVSQFGKDTPNFLDAFLYHEEKNGEIVPWPDVPFPQGKPFPTGNYGGAKGEFKSRKQETIEMRFCICEDHAQDIRKYWTDVYNTRTGFCAILGGYPIGSCTSMAACSISQTHRTRPFLTPQGFFNMMLVAENKCGPDIGKLGEIIELCPVDWSKEPIPPIGLKLL